MSSNKQNNLSERPRGLLERCLGLVFHDVWRKLVALGLGVLCWYGIRSTLKSSVAGQHWFTVENVYVDIPSAEIPGGERFYFVRESRKLGPVSLDVAVDFWHQDEALPSSDFRIELRLENLSFTDDGRRTEPLTLDYHLTDKDIREKPAEVTVRSFSPNVVMVQWDKYVTREIPVHTNYRNWLSPDYAVNVKVEPETVTVTGPAFRVNQINAIQTTEFEIRDDTMGFDGELSLVPPSVPDCALSQKEVKVKVEVRNNAEVVRRRFEGVRVNILHRVDATLQVDRSSVDSDQVAVIVNGPAERVNQLEAKGLSAYCDLTSFSTPGVQNVKVQILGLPPGVTAAIEPSEFKRLKLIPQYGGEHQPQSAVEENALPVAEGTEKAE